jgi:uncharacterized protein (TIGR03437 family)
MKNLVSLWKTCAFISLSVSGLWAQSYTLTTIAGIDRSGDGKLATQAPLRFPVAAVQDANGVTYIADAEDHRIRRVSAQGIISTVAGTGRSGFSGDDGPAVLAELDFPVAVRLDGNGNLFIADYNNQRIRKVNLTTGIITTVVGNGDWEYNGDGVPAAEAAVDPRDFEIDSAGNFYIADAENNRIRKVTASSGIITTIAGNGLPGFSGENSVATSGRLNYPTGIALDPQGNIYVVDAANLRVRRITVASGIITTIAGTGFLGTTKTGPVLSASLYYPVAIAYAQKTQQLVVAGFAYIYVIATNGEGNIRFVAGSDQYGFDDSDGQTSLWGDILSVSYTPKHELLIGDSTNYRIRRVVDYDLTRSFFNPPRTDSLAKISTLAGVGIQYSTDVTKGVLNVPAGMALNGSGGLIFADRKSHIVRSLQAGQIGRVFGDGYPTSGSVRVNDPSAVARDAQGNIYIADRDNSRVVRVPITGPPTVFAGGTGFGIGVSSAPATKVPLLAPVSLALDGPTTLYVADEGGCRIRQIRNDLSTLIAGNGSCVFSGDNGPATQAGLTPTDIVLDGKGGLLVADSLNNRIRRIDLTTGIITTIAGTGSPVSSGDGGAPEAAGIPLPRGIAVDSAGRIAIAQYFTSTIRMIHEGKIHTIAGTGAYASSAETGAATAVSFDPVRLLFDINGVLYAADEYNDRIRKLTPAVPANLQVLQGMNQSGAPGTKITVVVKVTEASATPVGSLPVKFEVVSGTATLSVADAETTNTGVAETQVTLGSTAGPLTIRATVAGLSPVTIPMTIVAPTSSLDEGGVVGSGLSFPSVRAGSAGGIMSAFGKKLGPGAAFIAVTGADLVNGAVPTKFAGLCVDVSGTKAPILGASDTLVNFIFPSVPLANAAVSILTDCGTANEKATNAITIPVQTAAPEFFPLTYSLDGHNPIATRDAITNGLIGPANLFPGSGIRPAKPNDILTLYGTGFGNTNPTFAPGSSATGAAPVTGVVRVLFNGEPLPADQVLYAGATPFSPGLFQLNLKVPNGIPAGDYTVVLEIDGIKSPPFSYLAVVP